MKQKKPNPTKEQVTSKQENVVTREDFLNFLRKVSRPIPTKKQGGKSSEKEKSKTSE